MATHLSAREWIIPEHS